MKSDSVWRHFDLWLLSAVLLLTAYGVLAIKSAVTGAPAFETYPQRQIIFAFIGVAIMLAIAAIDYRILTSAHWYVYAFLIASLIFVAVIGVINNDSRRWISLGFIQLQPSEFGRVFIAVTFAAFLVRRQDKINRFSNTIGTLLYIGLPVALIFLAARFGHVHSVLDRLVCPDLARRPSPFTLRRIGDCCRYCRWRFYFTLLWPTTNRPA